jgi:hypothetical protein
MPILKGDIGGQPIEPEPSTSQMMRDAAQAVDRFFNGDLRGPDRPTGFVLLVFPFNGDRDSMVNYISNGVERADMVKMLRSMANRFDEATQ